MKYINVKDLLPDGDYEVIYNGKTVAKFKSLEQAQVFTTKYNLQKATIKFPDLRRKMNKEDLATLEYLLRQTGDSRDMYRR